MIRILFITSLLIVTTSIFAQDSSTKKHEIGASIYSFTNATTFTSGGDKIFNHLPQNNFANAFLYKYHLEKVAFRFNLNYQYKNFPDEVAPNQFVKDELYYGKIWTIGTKVGFERTLGKSKLKPIIAFDAFYNYGENSGKPYYYLNPIIDLINDPGTTLSHSGGISPTIGVMYQILPRLSLRIETNAELGWYKQGYKSSKENLNAGIYFIYNPLSTFSINFHF